MRICYVSQGFYGSGSTFYRLVFPLRELEKQGHWAKTPLYDTKSMENGDELVRFDLTRLPKADIYVFQMPLDVGEVGLIRTLRKNGHPVVCELDDTTMDLPEWHPAYLGTDPRQNATRNRDHRHSAYRAADALTVSTPALAESHAKLNPVIEVLPNYLLGEMWAKVIPQYTTRRDRVRIGWMGRAHWRQGDLNILKPWFGDFLRAHPEVDFVAAGDETVHDILEVPEAQRISEPSIKFPIGLADITASMDIGLVPLQAHPFNEAKSHLKGMEYAACGIPCVASPTESYRAWVDENQNGLLASSPQDWVAALSRLVGDRELTRRMGAAAEAKALANTIDKHAHRWEDFYEWLIERKQAQRKPRMALTG